MTAASPTATLQSEPLSIVLPTTYRSCEAHDVLVLQRQNAFNTPISIPGAVLTPSVAPTPVHTPKYANYTPVSTPTPSSFARDYAPYSPFKHPGAGHASDQIQHIQPRVVQRTTTTQWAASTEGTTLDELLSSVG